MTATYHWLRVRSAGRSWADSHARFEEADLEGAEIWGAFYGLFGLRSNELIVVAHGIDDAVPAETSAEATEKTLAEAGFEIVESHALAPTVRPERFEPLTRPGLYVFRLFDVANTDVDEIARLSNEAWTSFENSDRYAAEPQALFAQADRAAPFGVMVLLTWYDGLDSWQASRGASPEATENFRRRRALTRGALPYATRLVGT